MTEAKITRILTKAKVLSVWKLTGNIVALDFPPEPQDSTEKGLIPS